MRTWESREIPSDHSPLRVEVVDGCIHVHSSHGEARVFELLAFSDPSVARRFARAITTAADSVDKLASAAPTVPDGLPSDETTLATVALSETDPKAQLSPGTKAGLEERFPGVFKQYPRAWAPWTSAEQAKLIELHRRAASESDIAKLLGRKVGAIRSRLGHLRDAGALPAKTAGDAVVRAEPAKPQDPPDPSGEHTCRACSLGDLAQIEVVASAPDECPSCGQDEVWGCTRGHAPWRVQYCKACGHATRTQDTFCPYCEDVARKDAMTTAINMGPGVNRINWAICERHAGTRG